MKQRADRLFRLKANPHNEPRWPSLCRRTYKPHSAIGHRPRSVRPGIALVALIAVACSTPGEQLPPSRHHHEVAVAWATVSATDGFHFPISCPGPEKLVLFANAKFQISCDGSEKIKTTMTEVAPEEPASDDAGAQARKSPPLKCYLVVVPDFKTVPGVVTDMRRGIAAKRTGPVDCALIRYD